MTKVDSSPWANSYEYSDEICLQDSDGETQYFRIVQTSIEPGFSYHQSNPIVITIHQYNKSTAGQSFQLNDNTASLSCIYKKESDAYINFQIRHEKNPGGVYDLGVRDDGITHTDSQVLLKQGDDGILKLGNGNKPNKAAEPVLLGQDPTSPISQDPLCSIELFEMLPLEVITYEIFSRLDLRDIVKTRQLSKLPHNYLYKLAHKTWGYTAINFDNIERRGAEITAKQFYQEWKLFNQFFLRITVQNLKKNNISFFSGWVTVLVENSAIQDVGLDFSGERLKEEAQIALIKLAPKLTILIFEVSEYSVDQVNFLAQLISLKRLKIRYEKQPNTDNIEEIIGKLPWLKELCVKTTEPWEVPTTTQKSLQTKYPNLTISWQSPLTHSM